MTFKTKELKKFLLSIHKQKITNINIQSSNLILSINTTKNKSSSPTRKSTTYGNINKEAIAVKHSSDKIASEKPQFGKEQNLYFTIVSPMIGTFYRSPGPNEEPFVNTNDLVKVNQTVCIIEAMKLMNEIESEVNGHVAEILVEDGDIVDCGQALMRIKQD